MRCMDTHIDRQIVIYSGNSISDICHFNILITSKILTFQFVFAFFEIFHVSFQMLYAFTRMFKISFVSQSLPCTFALLPNSKRRGTSYLQILMFTLEKFERNISNKQGFTVSGIYFEYSEKCSGLLAELIRIYSPLSLYVLAV